MNWREEIIGDCRMILADCRDVLPTLGKVDAVLTDPPYGIGHLMVGSGHFSQLAKRMGEWDKEPPPPRTNSKGLPHNSLGRKLFRFATFQRLVSLAEDQCRSKFRGCRIGMDES